MGQENENEIKDPQLFLKEITLYEEQLKKENISSDDYSFKIAKRIAQSYLAYESMVVNTKEGEKSKKNKISIIGNIEAKKLDEINNEFKILKKWIKMVNTPYKSKLKRLINKIVDEDKKDKNNNKSINFDNYTDKYIEEKLLSFYNKYETKFKKRLYKGPPDCFRTLSWCIVNKIPLERDINIYYNYLLSDLEEEKKNQLKYDISRTFMNLIMNKDEKKKIKKSLYNVLKAFWNLDKNCGYCQGMNLIVGFMLLIFEGNELDTFYMLISLISDTFTKKEKYEYSFRGLFCEGFPLVDYFMYIFDILLGVNVPDVKKHLEELGIPLYLWIGRYIQSLFTIILPLKICKRLWDCIFSDNIYFLIKFGIAFTISIKTEILESNWKTISLFFKGIQESSMSPDCLFFGKRLNIEKIISRASEIKIDPEEYIKSYKKKGNYKKFEKNMEGNTNITYSLKKGNVKWNEWKLKERNTILFKEGENKNENDDVKIDQIKELYGEDFEENEIENGNLKLDEDLKEEKN